MTQQLRYFAEITRYYKLVMLFSVTFYMFPVGDTLTVKQIAYGAVTVFLSWLNITQVLKLIPVLGVYIILVEKVFWSVAKVCTILLVEIYYYTATRYKIQHNLLPQWFSFKKCNRYTRLHPRPDVSTL